MMVRIRHGSRKVNSGDEQDNADETEGRRGLDARPRVETSHIMKHPYLLAGGIALEVWT